MGTATGAYNIFPFLGGAIFMTLTGKMMEVSDGAVASVAQYKSVWLLMFACMVFAFLCLLVSKEKGAENTATPVKITEAGEVPVGSQR